MKKNVTKTINYPLYWSYGTSISEIKEDLVKLEELGATHVDIEENGFGDGTYISIEAKQIREETEEEYQERIDKENKKFKLKEDAERKLYEQLKLKYEK